MKKKTLRNVLGALAPGQQAADEWLFVWKYLLLVVLILLSILVYRPFCRYLCPLGAIYGLLTPSHFTGMRFEKTRVPAAKPARRPASSIFPFMISRTAPTVSAASPVKNLPAICSSFQKHRKEEEV